MLDLDNKTLVVSIRRIDNNGQVTFDTFFADVTSHNETTIRVIRRNGEEMSLPYDEDVYEVAEPGFYELQDGDTHENPDLIARWTVFASETAAAKYRHLNL
jgi:arabinogalactan endo-1,4-beta-galactosidase